MVLDAVLVRCPFRLHAANSEIRGTDGLSGGTIPACPPPGNGFPFRFLARSRKSAGNWISPNRRPSPGSPERAVDLVLRIAEPPLPLLDRECGLRPVVAIYRDSGESELPLNLFDILPLEVGLREVGGMARLPP